MSVSVLRAKLWTGSYTGSTFLGSSDAARTWASRLRHSVIS